MSSLDGIGRYFPLTLFACADDDAAIPPPELNSQDDWFDAAERLLLSTLDHDANFEEITAHIDEWPIPHQEPLSSQDVIPTLVVQAEGRDFGEVFRSVRLQTHHKIFSGSTFWWTIGGDGFPPVALSGKHMPDPYVFSAMLTGGFVKT